MTPTLGIFRQALQTPDLSLATLTEARAATGADGMPHLMRTTRFAEAEISWHGAHWLLFMPLSPAALAAVERTASQTARLNTELLTEYRILPDELRWVDASGVPRATSLILQRLPEGRTFDEALHTVPAERLAEALGELRDGLGKLGFSHNNLRPENLRWTGTRFVPLRYHDARFGTPGSDDAAFEALLERIRLSAGTETLSDAAASYTALPRFDGHRWVSHIFEGLVCVEDEGGYGFVDTENREVIPAWFRWAGDFHEGRAEVETDTGMGLIDREGRYVIPPRYEIVDYDPAESIVRVRLDGRWALFDHLGHRLTEFGDIEAEA